MNITGFFSSLFGGSVNRYYNVITDKGPVWISIDGKESQLYREIPQLKTVIDRKASMLSNGRFQHYNKNGELIENSEFVKLLQTPNPLQSGSEWLMQLDVQKSLYGNSFTHAVKGGIKDTPRALHNLPPIDMEVIKTGKIYKQFELKEIIKGYKLNRRSEKAEEFDVEEVMHLNLVNPDDPIIGLSPLHALTKPLSNISASYSYRNVIMTKKGAIGILSNKSSDGVAAMPLNKKERKRIEKQYQNDYGIEDEKSKVIVTDSSLHWQPMTYPTKDLLLFEEVDADFMTIIDTYGMDVNLFSSEKGTTYSNLYQGIKSAYENTIIPESESITKALSRFFGLDEKGEYIALSYDHLPILQSDQNKEAETLLKKVEAYVKLQSTGWTRNELEELFPLDELVKYI